MGDGRATQVMPPSIERYVLLVALLPTAIAAVDDGKVTERPLVRPVGIAALHVAPLFVVRLTLPLVPISSAYASSLRAVELRKFPKPGMVLLAAQVLPLSVDRNVRGTNVATFAAVPKSTVFPNTARLFAPPNSPLNGVGKLDWGTRLHVAPPFVVVYTTKYPISGSPIRMPLFASVKRTAL